MIFVTLGTQAFPFDRLLEGLDSVSGEELVIQGGTSTFRPKTASWFDFLELPQLVEYVRKARVVVSHAGVGSVMTVVAEGKRPVVVPRVQRHGEAVDDHQVPFARRAASAGLVTLVEDAAALAAALGETPAPPHVMQGAGTLVDDLRSYLRELAGYSR
jgi:UDP-N-acetylglucosamine transferase subunit ALG13